MKFRVTREVLADAVAWTARSLPPRPSVPVLAGILLEVDGSQLSVSGFDYEVSARAEVDVQATESGRVLVPGRLLDAEFVKYRAIMPSESAAHALLPVHLFTDAAKRVALVAERGTPLRCEFTPGQVTLRAGGTDDEGQAEERCDVEFEGEPLTIGFNPTFLLDGLAAVHTERARMHFTSPLKPAVLSGVEDPATDEGAGDRPAERPGSYRYLIMPVRLPS